MSVVNTTLVKSSSLSFLKHLKLSLKAPNLLGVESCIFQNLMTDKHRECNRLSFELKS